MSSSGFYHFHLGRPVGDLRPDESPRDVAAREILETTETEVDKEEETEGFQLTSEVRAEIASEVLAETEDDGSDLLRELGMDDLKLEVLREAGRRRVVEMLVERLAAGTITVRQVGRFNRNILVPLFGSSRSSGGKIVTVSTRRSKGG